MLAIRYPTDCSTATCIYVYQSEMYSVTQDHWHPILQNAEIIYTHAHTHMLQQLAKHSLKS